VAVTSKIPPAILKAIEQGDAILFLGSGASYDALLSNAPVRIKADDVKIMLADGFLGGAYKDRSLMTVADFVRNEASLLAVQASIHKRFIGLEASSFQRLIPLFKWKAIITTNYDLIVEDAYQKTPARLQELAPVVKNGPDLQKALSKQNSVPFLKIHGCISHYKDTDVPIVLDSLEYAKFKNGREHLVTAFQEWAVNHPILFCGYSLSDDNIKQILFDIGDASQTRPQYLYVQPGLEDIEMRFWSQRRIAPYSGTYEEFLVDADYNIPKTNRSLAKLLSKSTLTISKWIPSHESPSQALIQYLSAELLHVLPDAPPAAQATAESFFSGLDDTFAPIYELLDIRRRIVDELLNRVVLDTIKSTVPKFFVLQGYAGCGKSVIARRLAIETSAIIDAPLVVYLREGAVLRFELLLELQNLVQSRLYLFIDDLFELTDVLPAFLDLLKTKNIPITIFACSRTNEFGILGPKYSGKVTADFEVGDLDREEIDALLQRLSAHKLLGPLEGYAEAERALFVEKFYGGQLLVALHEITRGDSFEDIVVDEFEKITPRAAQQMYLDICTMHQCGVGARAGLLSRLSGLDISSLKSYLSAPLAKVVRGTYDYRYRDMVYRSRHDGIARMVFDLAIPSAERRAEQLKRILGRMDLDYSSDKKAFFELVKGKRLAEDFESKVLANSIFDAAEDSAPPASYLLHQRAILELTHKKGNLEIANDLLKKAEIEVKKEGHRDSSIQHTRANLLRRRANAALLTVERDRYRAEARAILRPQLGSRINFYPENLYGQLLLDEIQDALEENKRQNHALVDGDGNSADPLVHLMSELNNLIDNCLRQRPADAPMTLLKAEFLKTLGKNPHAISLLQRYCENNITQSSVVRTLADTFVEDGKVDEAIALLKPAILSLSGDKALNLSIAKALMKQNEVANSDTVLMHLRRSFTDGDSNYEARILFARFNMLYADLARGKAEFDELRKIYLDGSEKPRFLVIDASGDPQRFNGRVATKQLGYGFVSTNELKFQPFFGKRTLEQSDWGKLQRGDGVTFLLGFTFRGPTAVEVQIT
jgi:cold shock CspA family protein